ncbi:MAG: LuxR C-terminal-related transcriptional regulator [Acidimicrobiia bacterium]|nr:LuxR C-terminal-related transcriptional regulator [Acidimicrobiia bacterium]
MVGEAGARNRLAPSVWADTFRSLVASKPEELSVTDLEVLAIAAYLHGDDDVSTTAWERAYGRHLDDGDNAEAARCSFWLALTLMLNGRMAHAGGWLSRARGAVGDDLECAAAGYLLIPPLLGALDSGDAAAAADFAVQASAIGRRSNDADLLALATLGHGQALIARGDTTDGLAKLDEVMLSVEASDVGPVASGIVYCAVILECMQVLDLARALEWTDALDDWCRAQPELVPFRGQCLVHQSQLRQAAGKWEEAVAAVALARERLSDPPHPALGLAHYQEAELLRAKGSLDAAADSYALANRAGHEPLPGLALLSLDRGDVQAAAATIRRGLEEVRQPTRRAALLYAAVEIYRAAGDREAATSAAAELEMIAADSTSEVVGAIAKEAKGAVRLDSGDISSALAELRAAAGMWQRLAMPFEAARTGVLIGLACAALGDATSASLEFDHARATFASLGADTALARLKPLAEGLGTSSQPRSRSAALSNRELEVLAHVAAGRTSPEIAEELTISRHTVRRHLDNIFAKLGVRSRAAATAYAYEHDLL